MAPRIIKIVFNLSLALAFVSAVMLITGKTYGYQSSLRNVLYISGGLGIILQLYFSIFIEKNKEFNLLFWIGTVVIFIAVIMKTLNMNYFHVALLAGAGITGLSYFINPFDKKDDEQDQKDQLLDS